MRPGESEFHGLSVAQPSWKAMPVSRRNLLLSAFEAMPECAIGPFTIPKVAVILVRISRDARVIRPLGYFCCSCCCCCRSTRLRRLSMITEYADKMDTNHRSCSDSTRPRCCCCSQIIAIVVVGRVHMTFTGSCNALPSGFLV